MPDPFTTATGLAPLLASIFSVSIKLNELRDTFIEAEHEIDSGLRELGDLTNVLKSLQHSPTLSKLPDHLLHSLTGVLNNCQQTAQRTERVLLDAYLKRFRRIYWASVGKNEFLQQCQRLAAHKATIGINLTWGTWETTNRVSEKIDQFISNVKQVHQLVPEKDIMLRRYLEDTESYAESMWDQSSATYVDDQYQQYEDDDDEDKSGRPTDWNGGKDFHRIDQNRSYSPFPPSPEHGFKPTANGMKSGSNHQNKIIFGRQHELSKTLSGHSSGISSVVFSSGGRLLVSGSWDGTLRIWDVETELSQELLHAEGDDVTSVVFVGDESLFASAGSDGVIRLWDIETVSLLQALHGHNDRISGIAYSILSGQLASGSGDGTIRIWDINSGSTANVLRGDCGGIWSISLNDDGRQLISGFGDGTISIWDVRTESTCNSLTGHSDGVWSMSLVGDILASGSWDSSVMLWDLRMARSTKTLWGHDDRVTSVVFIDEGWLASGSEEEKTIKVWDTKTGSVVQTLDSDGGGISSIAFSSVGMGRLASGSGDRMIRLWSGLFSAG